MDQSTESLHVPMAQLMAKMKGLAVCVTSLSEMEAKCTDKMKQILTRIGEIEAKMNEIESVVAEGTRTCASRSSGGSKGVSNEHPLLKVCYMISPVFSVLKTLVHGAHNIFSAVWSGGICAEGETYQ